MLLLKPNIDARTIIRPADLAIGPGLVALAGHDSSGFERNLDSHDVDGAA